MLLPMAAAWPAVALAEVTVTPAAKGYDVDVIGQVSSSEVLEAIISATGVEIQGTPGDTTVNSNHLRGASLERALRALLPHAGFVVRSDAAGKPAAIIFLAVTEDGAAPTGADTAAPEMPTDVPLQPDGALPDGAPPESPPPDATVPDAPAPDAAAPDGGSAPAQDVAPAGTQGG